MKRTFFVTIILAAFMLSFSSCNKESGIDAGKGNTLVVKVTKAAITKAATRAIEDQVDPYAEGATDGYFADIDNLFVIMMTGSGTIVEHDGNTVHNLPLADLDDNEGYYYFEQVPASVGKVLVVGNLSTADETAFGGFTTDAEIQAYALTAASQNLAAKEGVDYLFIMGYGNVVLGGAPPVGFTGFPASHDPDHLYGEAYVTVQSVTSRFQIGTVIPGENVWEVELVQVFVNNVYTQLPKSASTLSYFSAADVAVWATTPATSSTLTAADIASAAYSGTGFPAIFTDAASSLVTTTSATSKAYAYNFFSVGSPEELPHLILLVKGQYSIVDPEWDGVDPDEEYIPSGVYFLQYVTYRNFFNAATGGTKLTSFLPNYIYNIGLAAPSSTGFPDGDEDGGIPIDADDLRPTAEMDDYNLGVNVTITPWWTVRIFPKL